METNQLFDSEPQSIKNLREACPKSYKQLSYEWFIIPDFTSSNQKLKIKENETVSKNKNK